MDLIKILATQHTDIVEFITTNNVEAAIIKAGYTEVGKQIFVKRFGKLVFLITNESDDYIIRNYFKGLDGKIHILDRKKIENDEKIDKIFENILQLENIMFREMSTKLPIIK